jgi:hypothetical protein
MLPRLGRCPEKLSSLDVPMVFPTRFSGKIWSCKMQETLDFIGRGSWIRTNDLQYPKLPRYQAALYPDQLGNDVDTRFMGCQQGGSRPLTGR